MKIKKFFQKYDEANNYLKELNIKTIDKIKSFIFGYLIALIFVLGPLVVLTHSFIYSFYFELIVLFLGLMVVVFFSLGEILNHKLLIHYANIESKSLKELHILDTLVYLLICLVCCLVIIILF